MNSNQRTNHNTGSSAIKKSRKQAATTIEDNQSALKEASRLQQSTKDALSRIQQHAAETEMIGTTTLAELQEQQDTINRALDSGDVLGQQLEQTEKLQNRLARWTWSFNSRGKARKQAKLELDRGNRLQEKRAARSVASEKNRSSSTTADPSTSREVSWPENQKTIATRTCRLQSEETREPPDCDAEVADRVEQDSSGEYQSELDQLATTDKEIDDSLDQVASQLDRLLEQSMAMNSEIHSHSSGIAELDQSLQDSSYKQRVVNHRARRFLTGRVRDKYEN